MNARKFLFSSDKLFVVQWVEILAKSLKYSVLVKSQSRMIMIANHNLFARSEISCNTFIWIRTIPNNITKTIN